MPQQLSALTGLGALAYSRYGNGRSPVLREPRTLRYMHDEARVLGEILEAYGIGDAILIGHSDGASIALIHCGGNAPRVRACIVLAPHLFVEDRSIRGIGKARDLYESTDLRDRLARYHTDPDATFYGWNRIWLDPPFAAWNIREYTTRIAVPIFAIQGAGDEYGTFAQIEALREDVQAPVDALHLANCGHDPLRDRRAATLRAIGDYIREIM